MREQSFEHEAIWTDVNVGMRSANLDLTRPDQKAALRTLVPDADVFIDGFSGRCIERLGFGIDEVAALQPKDSVYLTMRGYSWDGPWKMVRTFDMEALAATGFTIAEGSGGFPSYGQTFPEPQGARRPDPRRRRRGPRADRHRPAAAAGRARHRLDRPDRGDMGRLRSRDHPGLYPAEPRGVDDNRQFLNQAFSTSPTIASPLRGAGAVGTWFPKANYYMLGGVYSANSSDTGTTIDEVFDTGELFYQVEVG